MKQPAPFAHTQDQQSTICQFSRVETTSKAICIVKMKALTATADSLSVNTPVVGRSLVSFRSHYCGVGLPCRVITSRSLCWEGHIPAQGQYRPLSFPMRSIPKEYCRALRRGVSCGHPSGGENDLQRLAWELVFPPVAIHRCSVSGTQQQRDPSQAGSIPPPMGLCQRDGGKRGVAGK